MFLTELDQEISSIIKIFILLLTTLFFSTAIQINTFSIKENQDVKNCIISIATKQEMTQNDKCEARLAPVTVCIAEELESDGRW